MQAYSLPEQLACLFIFGKFAHAKEKCVGYVATIIVRLKYAARVAIFSVIPNTMAAALLLL